MTTIAMCNYYAGMSAAADTTVDPRRSSGELLRQLTRITGGADDGPGDDRDAADRAGRARRRRPAAPERPRGAHRDERADGEPHRRRPRRARPRRARDRPRRPAGAAHRADPGRPPALRRAQGARVGRVRAGRRRRSRRGPRAAPGAARAHDRRAVQPSRPLAWRCSLNPRRASAPTRGAAPRRA